MREKGIEHIEAGLLAQWQRKFLQSAEVRKLLGKAERTGGDSGLDSAEVLADAPEICLGRFPP